MIELNDERIYAFSPSANVVVRAIIPQHFSQEHWEDTVKELVKKLPYLNSVYMVDEERKAHLRELWYMVPQIIFLNRNSKKFYRKVLQEEERIPFVRRNNPLYRLVVLEDEECSELLWISHRMLFDEESTKRVCRTFLALLQGEMPSELNFTIREELPESLNYYWNFKKNHILHHYAKHQHQSSEYHYREMFMHYYTTHRTKVEEINFTCEETAKLLQYCERHHLKLEQLIPVCFACAQQKNEQKDTKSFHTIVLQDTSSSKQENELGHFKEVALFEYHYTARKTVIDNVEHYAKIVEKRGLMSEIQMHSLIHNLPLDLLADMYVDGDRANNDYAVSSLKKLFYDVKNRHGIAYLPLHSTICEGVTLFQVLPSISMSDEKQVCSLICNDCLSITMQYNRMNTNRKDMREIKNHVEMMLRDCMERK